MSKEIMENGIWLCIEEYDKLIKAEERLRILAEALKLESTDVTVTSQDIVRLAGCVLAEA